jgi:hypothetical protein
MSVNVQIARCLSKTLRYYSRKRLLMTGSHPQGVPCPAKCRQCICGIQDDRGIWCARLKKIPTPWEVKRCRRFCPKAILNDNQTTLRNEEVFHEGNH